MARPKHKWSNRLVLLLLPLRFLILIMKEDHCSNRNCAYIAANNKYSCHFLSSCFLSWISHKPTPRLIVVVIVTIQYMRLLSCMSLKIEDRKMAVTWYFATSIIHLPNYFFIVYGICAANIKRKNELSKRNSYLRLLFMSKNVPMWSLHRADHAFNESDLFLS